MVRSPGEVAIGTVRLLVNRSSAGEVARAQAVDSAALVHAKRKQGARTVGQGGAQGEIFERISSKGAAYVRLLGRGLVQHQPSLS